MQSAHRSSDFSNLIDQLERKTFRKSFIRTMKGREIESATITLKPFVFGVESAAGAVYRKFFYNKHGQVIKKFYFDLAGAITMKEAYHFDEEGKILSSEFISDSAVLTEKYTYDSKGTLKEYFFYNPKWPRAKKEEYTVDKQGRKIKKVSYGLLGLPELVTHYLYQGDEKQYTFRHVTRPDGTLLLTFLYTWDSKWELQTGLYGFTLDPKAVTALMKTKDWEMASTSRSRWEYDARGNATGFIRDEPSQQILLKSDQFGLLDGNRIVTERSSSEFRNVGGKDYLSKTTEWLPRFNEPMKEVKEYSYFDKKGNPISVK